MITLCICTSIFFSILFYQVTEATEDNNLIKHRDEYCKITNDHTLCKYKLGNPDARCGEVINRNLTEDEKMLVMDLHNQKRMLIANGLEKRGDPGPQPPAANMMELIWDEELEMMAQVWAEQCVRNCMVNSCHDCPKCRKSNRFFTGQNYYNFGHFSGSWERSVEGWYDEVVDFNKTFVYPFYVIPGVLVGHYTQLVWGPTSRIGCGKIVHRPKSSKWGSQIFVCDYGIGGNLLRSEMYKVGPACSACPSGTSCSSAYPGLCSGKPDGPLTSRPPVHPWEIEGTFPTRKPIFFKNTTYPTNGDGKPIKPEIITEEFIKPPQLLKGDDKCIYTCRIDKGCSVKIYSNHPINGPISGSCFPPSFGGSCSGIPDDCKECVDVCEGKEGYEVTIEVKENGEPGNETTKLIDGDKKDEKEDSKDEKDECVYSCQKSGGCSVRIVSSGFVSGATMGSCFSERFGGECSGIPERCEACLDICKKKPEEQFSLPAKKD